MPQNPNLEPVTLPMPLRFEEKPETEFVNDLDALRVELVDSPTGEQIRNVAYRYVKATWADSPEETDPLNATQRELSETLEDVMPFPAIPAGMEAMSFTFLIGESCSRPLLTVSDSEPALLLLNAPVIAGNHIVVLWSQLLFKTVLKSMIAGRTTLKQVSSFTQI